MFKKHLILKATMKTVNSPSNKETSIEILVLISLFLIITTIGSISDVSALDARILGGRMVLHGNVGDTIHKSIKIINNNSFEVTINLQAQGNFSSAFTFLQNNFTVPANQTKDANFTIQLTKEGNYNTLVVVKFLPTDPKNGKNGIALPATIITVIGNGNSSSTTTDPNPNTGKSNFSLDSTTLGIMFTCIILIVLVILFVIYSKSKKTKLNDGGKKEEVIKFKKREEK